MPPDRARETEAVVRDGLSGSPWVNNFIGWTGEAGNPVGELAQMTHVIAQRVHIGGVRPAYRKKEHWLPAGRCPRGTGAGRW